MRLIYMGTPEFAVPSLEALLQSPHEVVGVVTQPDRPKGRGKVLSPSRVKEAALRHRLPVLQPVKMKDPFFIGSLRDWCPDLIVVVAFGRILPKQILNLPLQGCVNVHASLLPMYRGAAPIAWAIVNGDTETGITTMFMDEGMDTGDIILQERVSIAPDETAGELSARLSHVGAELLLETLTGLENGRIERRPQDDRYATMAPLLRKEDGVLDWNARAVDMTNRIRGLAPWPGAYTYARQERWTIWRAAPYAGPLADDWEKAQPGTIVKVGKAEILVATGHGILAILELQLSNRKRMAVAQFLAGHKISPGLVLKAEFPGSQSSVQSDTEE